MRAQSKKLQYAGSEQQTRRHGGFRTFINSICDTSARHDWLARLFRVSVLAALQAHLNAPVLHRKVKQMSRHEPLNTLSKNGKSLVIWWHVVDKSPVFICFQEQWHL